MDEFDLDKICRDYFRRHMNLGALQALNLNCVKVKAQNVEWTNFLDNEGTQTTGQAQFSRTERSGVEMTNDLTASNVYRPQINVTLHNGRVKGTNKRIWIEFKGQVKELLGDGIEIDPAKYSSEPEMSTLTLTTTSSKDMPGSGAMASSATVSTYQQEYSGQFTCEVVLSGKVIFVLQGEEAMEQRIKEIMMAIFPARGDIQYDKDKVVLTMTGSLRSRKDSRQDTAWH